MNKSDKKVLNDFIDCNFSNIWLKFEKMDVYVRKSMRIAPNSGGQLVRCFDIASISVEEEYQNTGIFTAFLEEVEKLDYAIYIENIFEKRLQNFFKKRGYEISNSLDAYRGTDNFELNYSVSVFKRNMYNKKIV